MARHRLSPVHWSRCTQEPLSQPPGSARNYGAGAHCSRLSKRLAEAADLALLVLSCVANTRRSTGQRMDPQPAKERSIASHMALVHLRVMPSGDVLARILGIAAKDVVTLDLLGPEELYGLVVL